MPSWEDLSRESFHAAQELRGLSLFRSSVNRSYYAAYTAATSVVNPPRQGYRLGRGNPSHEQLPGLIRNLGSLQIEIRRAVNRCIRRLRNARIYADYLPGMTVDEPLAIHCIRDAKSVRIFLGLNEQ